MIELLVQIRTRSGRFWQTGRRLRNLPRDDHESAGGPSRSTVSSPPHLLWSASWRKYWLPGPL